MALTEPKSEAWRIVSIVVGWIYFAAWTISFWPQIWTNYRRKRTDGLSYSFGLLNTVGFMCLSTYTIIKFILQIRYNMAMAVQIQDVCFAIHAFLACVVILVQIQLYDSRSIWVKYNKWVRWSIYFILAVALLHIILVASGVMDLANNAHMPKGEYKFSAWTLTEFFSCVKIVITLVKYAPQVYLNFKNKSTNGVAIWNWNLDVTGGIMSIAQNIIDYKNFDDASFVTDNIPKYIISCLSLIYDAIMLMQHYWWFRENTKNQKDKERLGIESQKSSNSTMNSDVEGRRVGDIEQAECEQQVENTAAREASFIIEAKKSVSVRDEVTPSRDVAAGAV